MIVRARGKIEPYCGKRSMGCDYVREDEKIPHISQWICCGFISPSLPCLASYLACLVAGSILPRALSHFSPISALFLGLIFFSITHGAFGSPDVTNTKSSPKDLAVWCKELKKEFGSLNWRLDPCDASLEWKISGASVQGRPLVYAEFGDPRSSNKTLVFTMVHGDEITPLYLGMQLVRWLKENQTTLHHVHVVVAPLVNPDSFLKKPRTRVNARGVDVNRNFSTKDWHSKALKTWKTRFRSNSRRFPGVSPDSEPETLFQKELITRFNPQKILSVHAPLNFMDYDGPSVLSLAKFPKEYIQECLKLRRRLRAVSGGFFPGSLGNYAGQEMGIPTLTLELPSADPARAEEYWKKFKTGIRAMIEFRMPELASRIVPASGS